MKLLNYIYEFLLGEDTDVPFEEPCDFIEITEKEPVILQFVSADGAA